MGCIETFSIEFDHEQKVKYITVGYVGDRFDPGHNTNGLGAVFGIFHAIGLPLPSGKPLRSLQYVASEVFHLDAKTYSTQNIPTWWTSEEKAGDGM